MDKKSWIIIFLIICCGILGYLLYNKSVLINNGGIVQARLDSIKINNKILNQNIIVRDQKISDLERQNDSLGALEIKTKTIYQKEYEKMDKLNTNQLCNQFDRVFTDADIK